MAKRKQYWNPKTGQIVYDKPKPTLGATKEYKPEPQKFIISPKSAGTEKPLEFTKKAEYEAAKIDIRKKAQLETAAKEEEKERKLKEIEELAIKPAEEELPPEKPKKDILKKVAEIGLTPATLAAEGYTDILERVTGQKYGQISAEEAVTTPFGEALGLGTAGAAIATTAGLVALGAGVGTGAVTATNTATVATTTSASALKLGVGKSIMTGILGVGGLGVVVTRLAGQASSIATESESQAKEIIEHVRQGRSYADALIEFSKLDNNINSAESSLKWLSNYSGPFAWILGIKDNQLKIANTKANMVYLRLELQRAAREAILTGKQ